MCQFNTIRKNNTETRILFVCLLDSVDGAKSIPEKRERNWICRICLLSNPQLYSIILQDWDLLFIGSFSVITYVQLSDVVAIFHSYFDRHYLKLIKTQTSIPKRMIINLWTALIITYKANKYWQRSRRNPPRTSSTTDHKSRQKINNNKLYLTYKIARNNRVLKINNLSTHWCKAPQKDVLTRTDAHTRTPVHTGVYTKAQAPNDDTAREARSHPPHHANLRSNFHFSSQSWTWKPIQFLNPDEIRPGVTCVCVAPRSHHQVQAFRTFRRPRAHRVAAARCVTM